MKNKIINIIILVSLIFVINTFAGGDKISSTMNESTVELNLILQPTTPIEATFEDDTIEINIKQLTPVTPKEATFEE